MHSSVFLAEYRSKRSQIKSAFFKRAIWGLFIWPTWVKGQRLNLFYEGQPLFLVETVWPLTLMGQINQKNVLQTYNLLQYFLFIDNAFLLGTIKNIWGPQIHAKFALSHECGPGQISYSLKKSKRKRKKRKWNKEKKRKKERKSWRKIKGVGYLTWAISVVAHNVFPWPLLLCNIVRFCLSSNQYQILPALSSVKVLIIFLLGSESTPKGHGWSTII